MKDAPEIPHQHETDAVIRLISQGDLNASLRTIAETLSISPEVVRTLMSWTGSAPKTLLWISQALTCELKQIGSSMLLQLFPKLRAHEHAQDNWRISSRETKVGFITNVFEMEYGQHWMEIRLKSKSGLLRPEKVC
jgi:fructose-1,6-bisphosphatase/sedoheptulose 1,7-bisphosphatase-like protein